MRDQEQSLESRTNANGKFDRDFSMENRYYARNFLENDDEA